MAVETTVTSANFTGTGASAAYAPGFYINSSDQVKVYVNNVLKTIGDDYTVNNVGVSTGCTVVANFPLGSAVYIERQTPITQLVDTQNNETILEDVLDAEFDKLTMISQEIAGKVLRALLVPQGETGFTLPAAADRANKFIAFDPLGAAIMSSGTGVDAGLRADLATLLSGASLVAFTNAVTYSASTIGRRLSRAVYAADAPYNAVGDGIADDTAALTAFWNHAIANPGVPHYLDAKRYKITSALPTINVSGVCIEGRGAEIHDVGAIITGTVLSYSGAATSTPIVGISSVSGASNQRVHSVKFLGIGIDCNTGACDYGLYLGSVMRCQIDAAVANAKVAGVDMNVVATLGETKDNQYNRIRLRLREVEYSGYGLRCGGDTVANTSFNEFWIDAQHKNGAAILCSNSDNNDWRVVRCFKTGGGTATESISLEGSNAGAGSASREERFWALTCNTPVHVYGTASFTHPSVNHQIFALDSDNSSPAPIVDAGASMQWRFAKSALDDSPWIAFPPTISSLTGSLTTVSNEIVFYRKFGKKVEFKIRFNIPNNGTGGTALQATLPFAAAGSAGNVFIGKERALTSKAMTGYLDAGSSTLIMQYYDGTYPGANGGIYSLSGSYECAS